jgi:proteasome lid subunit RPN8/RPN11
MTVVISEPQLKIIYDHAENIYPEECCGILLGTIDKFNKTVIEVISTTNVWDKSELALDQNIADKMVRTKHSRYAISPQDIFQTQKIGRDLQLEIIGFFHSHPDCPATPSTCDRSQAWEIYSYPIISVIQGKVSHLKSWVLDSDGIFQPEEIQITTHD